MKTRDIALAGLMAALTWVVTRAFVIPIPQTKGFFNLGEAAVFTAAILFGARVGAVAGGLGSALADLSLGYAAFAPYTFVIKGVEGFVVGSLGHTARSVAAMTGPIVALLLGAWAIVQPSWLVRGSGIVLIIVSGTALLLAARARRAGVRIGAMVSGGVLMILGYFIAEAFLMGLGVPAALVEVPYNTVQMTAGIVAGLASAVTFEQALLVPQR